MKPRADAQALSACARSQRQHGDILIGVGLHSGYNAAQRLYGLRGHVPDGRGVVHGVHFVQDSERIPFDDELVLHLTKSV